MLIGVGILFASLVSISFITELWQWILLDGIVLSTGAALIGNLVVNVTLSKWFVEKRGMAVGWASMGVSLAGVALTPAITVVIDHWGWRAGWRALAMGALLLVVPSALACFFAAAFFLTRLMKSSRERDRLTCSMRMLTRFSM